ncbi:CHAT domain-containing protein [Muricauda sp. SCSIO 64092]|uniref:CHAT domain-containing protein n=1 Tax=Allomuricauda sp. SCSIO 64092 TaxID=2908842 RepID=UPI001FF3FB53|nr:CHAT domain-containing tetratricopeptide repeat protein [Muricauda sp. SCSIO 64092]UOY05820.1 CHAT domain-containing protein [Muricauda sp. SCSIO 64092]
MIKLQGIRLFILCCFLNHFVFGNEYFDKTYSQINSNIETEDYEANFRLIDQLERADVFQRLDCYDKGRIYHKIGLSYYLAYREAEAIDYFGDKVLPLWENCSKVPISEKANTIYNLGICHQYLGNTEEAKGYLDQALNIFENTEDYPPHQLGLKYHGIGLFYESINDLFRAQLYFSNAINLFEQENDIPRKFNALNSTVTLHLDFKDYNRASEYVGQALELVKTKPDLMATQDVVPVYLNAAKIAFEQKKYDRAETLAKRALSLIDRQGSPQYYAIGLEVLAFLHMEKKEFKQAEDIMHEVLYIRKQFYQKGSGLEMIALTYENFAELYLKQGAFYRANEQLAKGFRMVAPNTKLDQRTVPTVSNIEIKNQNTLIRLMELKTRIFEQKYKKGGDLEWLQHSLDVQHKIDSVIKKGLLSLQFEQSKLEFLDVRFQYYGKAIQDALRLYDLTGDTYYLEQAHQFSARTKALTLQQELNRINTLRTTASKTILEEESSLRERMNAQQSLLFEASDNNRDSLLQSFLQAQNALDAFLIRLEEREPKYYRERYRFLKVPPIQAIQEKLPGDLAVLEFFESQESIYVFWISSTQFFSTTVPLTPKLRKCIERFTEQCGNPEIPFSQTDSQFIFEQLMEEGLSRLTNVERLCIIPDGSLHTLSFEVLHNGGGHLIEDYAFTYAYATQLLGRKGDNGEIPPEDYMGFAASYSNSLSTKLRFRKRFFGEEVLSPLSLSKKEVEQASKIFGGKTFLDDGASLENFYNNANNARILHLSLHGLVDTDDPSRSCIIFDDTKKEFLLSPPDLYKNRLGADLVLLSACHSANGKIYNGEGVQGMSKAFLLAGSQNVLSSLWNASESSSLGITHSFLTYVKQGVPFDLALQKAKLNYLKEVTPSQRHPYYWANFVLVGKVGPATRFPWYLIALAMGSSLVVGIFLYRYFKRPKTS